MYLNTKWGGNLTVHDINMLTATTLQTHTQDQTLGVHNDRIDNYFLHFQMILIIIIYQEVSKVPDNLFVIHKDMSSVISVFLSLYVTTNGFPSSLTLDQPTYSSRCQLTIQVK